MPHPDELPTDLSDAVRRQLRDARHLDPIPDDVTARLDQTLAELVTGLADAPSAVPASVDEPTAVPDELAARRRRRWGTGVLVAAAAALAVGFLGQNLPDSGSDADKSTATSLESGAELSPERAVGGVQDHDAQDSATAPDGKSPLRHELDGLASQLAGKHLNLNSDLTTLDQLLAASAYGAASPESTLPRRDRRALRSAITELNDAGGDTYLRRSVPANGATSWTMSCGPSAAVPDIVTMLRGGGRTLAATVSPPDGDGFRTVTFYDCSSTDPAAVWNVVRVPNGK